MKARILGLGLILAAALASAGRAGSQVEIRLIEASNQGAGISAGLQDVAGALRGSLVYQRYSLAGSRSVPVPPPASTVSLGAYRVTCSGSQAQLQIRITKGRNELLQTTVSLRDGKPVILGGFPQGESKMILVFCAR